MAKLAGMKPPYGKATEKATKDHDEMKFALAAVMLAIAVPAVAQESQPWRAVDADTGTIRDVQGLRQLAEDFPDSSSVRLRLLNAQLGEGDFDGLLDSLRWLKERDYVFSETARSQIPELVGEENAEAASALLLNAAKPIEASEIVATAPAEAGLIEGISSIEGTASEGEYSMIVTSVTGNSTHVHEPGAGWIEAPVLGAKTTCPASLASPTIPWAGSLRPTLTSLMTPSRFSMGCWGCVGLSKTRFWCRHPKALSFRT